MDSSFSLTIVAGTICFFMILKKFRFKQENNSSSISPSPSSLSTSLVPSSPSSHNWIHQVFPSFRGEDVRRDFLSHIQKEFQRKGIKPFIDNEIKRGESIGPELIRAIRGSKIAIILLSRNYASSKWCLDELVEIIKCREELGQTVMAIFYKVDPSDVKKLTGDFGKVFRKTCTGKSKEDIKRWKEALAKVATIAGYHSSNWDNEAAMIEKIATDVSNELINSAPSSDFDGLVGMRFHIENMEWFLRPDSDEVRMIGIWGPSGIGKSTIARVLFSKHSHQFQLSVFMENVKRQYPRPCYDEYSAKLQLQSEFLSQIINQKDIKLRNLDGVQHILKENKVFVVLDDVDQLAQLEALAKELWWFGPRSRIIITTQDIKLLNAHGINHIYEVGFPSDNEAFQIFCMYAFPQKSPNDGFENLVWEVIEIVGTLPLGLRVMGSYFKGMSKNEWKRELPRLRIRTDGEIESILKFSYDALSDEEKDLFLYIACFFKGEDIEKVKAHLADNFCNVGGSLRILLEKSLIFTSSRYIRMHNLLASLGREIVRKESTNDPGKRRFLVDAREIGQTLSHAITDSRSVIGIDIDCFEIKDKLNISDEAFERMPSLQFLRICWGCQLPQSLNPPRKVRLLHWEYFVMTSFPSSFNPEFLVELNMPNSNLEKLWEGNQTIRNLKWMNLSGSKNLKDLPDLSTATNLQELNLSDCSSLRELPSSIGNAVNLVELDLMGCSSLVELPSSIGNAINLILRLDLSCCSSLVELPSSIGNAINLKVLDLRDCSSLKELPSCIGNAINLKELNLTGCSSLVGLPSSIGNAINLSRLKFRNCPNLVELPSSIGNITNLESLNLYGCESIMELPASIGNITGLKILDLTRCSSIVESIGEFPRAFVHITELNLSETTIQEIAPWIKSMSNLHELVIKRCRNLVSLPQLPNSLSFLDAEECQSLESLDCSFDNTEFSHLNFSSCFRLNKEARDLIINTSTSMNAILPGEEVPTYFTYRTTGSSLSMTLNGFDTHFPTPLRFKACLLLEGDLSFVIGKAIYVSYRIKDKQNGVNDTCISKGIRLHSPPLREHLFIFEFEETVSSNELVFEFQNDSYHVWEIGECGIHLSNTLGPEADKDKSHFH